LRSSFVQFNLCAHFLQASSKRFNLLLLPLDNRLLLLVFAVLFKELVEQHRVYGVVAHRVGFAIFVPSHQIRAYLFDWLDPIIAR
jgi:hypothetical protein